MNNSKKLMLQVCMLFVFVAFAQNSKQSTTSSIAIEKNQGVFKFNSETLDYGTILQNSNGKREFIFKNIGQKPILINSVKGSCGCTVATKPEKPIMPGETASIKVKYATNRLGKFSKSITITSNANESKKIIRIKGNVVKEGITLNTKKSNVSAN